MAELLLELFSEEIPARMQTAAAADLERLVTGGLVDAGLTYEGAKAFATPRRLALTVQGVSMRSPAVRSERKGPRVDAPDKAIQGFLRGAGLETIDQAQVQDDPRKGSFYLAVIEVPGRDAADIIADLLPDIVRRFPWPRTMRWGEASTSPGALRWIRPLRAITCTFGPDTEVPEIVPIEIDGLQSGRTTFGHRFHAPEPIQVRRYEDYAESLEAAKVVIDPERRREIIRTEARQLAFARGLQLVEDEALVEEVAGLVEWPVALMGSFDTTFLTMPSEVIRLTIRANQKCFVLEDGDGHLSNRFVLIANIEAADGGKMIVKGNERVVAARLSDAAFFWQNDLSIPLETRLDSLRQVTFHERIGSQHDRVMRLVDLAGELAAITGAEKAQAERAAQLAKADLATEMVYEFPELQGVMGRYYAQAQGEAPAVADAIAAHYRPQGPADEVPRDPVTVAVALADRLDLLSAFWAIDETPTGSKDPYALRRAALGVVRLVLTNRIHLPLHPMLAERIKAHRTDGIAERVDSLIAFLTGRLKVQLRDSGVAHDLIDAVFALGGQDDLLTLARRAEALQAFLDTADGADLLGGYRRAANILAAEEKKGTAIADEVTPTLFEQDEERALFGALTTVEGEVGDAVGREAFEEAMGRLATLRGPVDGFFEAVLVNAEDVAVRANRLALLHRLRRATYRVADFSKIEGRS